MLIFIAIAWTVVATFYLELIVAVSLSWHQLDHLDLVSCVLSQSAAFLLVLFFILRVHARDREVADAIGLRQSAWPLYPLALVQGIVLQAPASLLGDLIDQRWPEKAEEIAARAEALAAPHAWQKVLLFVAATLVGPLVEEMFFRGGLLRIVLKAQGSLLTVLAVSVIFAAAHLDPTQFFPIFAMSLVLTFARIQSGSLLPSLLMHGTFNAVSVVASFRHAPFAADAPFEPRTPASPDWGLGLGGLAATVAMMLIFRQIAVRSESCGAGRILDLA